MLVILSAAKDLLLALPSGMTRRSPAVLDLDPVHSNFQRTDAGWSSLVARRAHNPKVAGSNPAPAIAPAGPRGPAGCVEGIATALGKAVRSGAG